MLTEICQYLKNWFDKDEFHNPLPFWEGEFRISEGQLDLGDELLDGQYFRIVGSVLNEGVHQYHSTETLTDEVFTGRVQSMAVPQVILSIANEIADWQNKYGGADSVAMSPFNSESFGGYSYSKSGAGAGNSSSGGSGAGGWQSIFASRLSPWRKI